MQWLSSPDTTRPREDDSFNLEHMNLSGASGSVSSEESLSFAAARIEAGTPRGKETTMGSCSGLIGVTSTLTSTTAAVVDDETLRFLELPVTVDVMIGEIQSAAACGTFGCQMIGAKIRREHS